MKQESFLCRRIEQEVVSTVSLFFKVNMFMKTYHNIHVDVLKKLQSKTSNFIYLKIVPYVASTSIHAGIRTYQ